MSYPKDEIVELQSLCEEVREIEEGGVSYFLLKALRLPGGCDPEEADVLFCPAPMHGYGARLFFPVQVKCRQALNWNMQPRIIERNWHAFSWQLKSDGLRLAQMVAVILGALR